MQEFLCKNFNAESLRRIFTAKIWGGIFMTLGNRILELRARSGLSQEEFGELFGASRQTVSRWELDLAIPEVQKIVLMARTFGVTVDSLISDGISTFDSDFKRFVCGVYR